jgi:hypothetical protein
MTKAKITKKNGYKCAPNGNRVETFPFGEVVTGQVADWALADHAASRMFDPVKEKKVVTPPETKAAPKKRGRPKKKAD